MMLSPVHLNSSDLFLFFECWTFAQFGLPVVSKGMDFAITAIQNYCNNKPALNLAERCIQYIVNLSGDPTSARRKFIFQKLPENILKTLPFIFILARTALIYPCGLTLSGVGVSFFIALVI